jgi:hypothetical protein
MEAAVQDWLDKQCSGIAGARHGLVLLAARGGQSLPAAVWPAGSRPPTDVHAAARDTVLGKLPIQRVGASESASYRIFSMPLRIGDRPLGALALAVEPSADLVEDEVMAGLRRALVHLYPVLVALPSAAPGGAEALRLNATVLAHADWARAWTAFANELAAVFRCQRVSLGIKEAGMVRVAAISHHGDEAGGSEAFGDIEAAMEEAVDQAAIIVFPAPPEAKPRITLAHAALARQTQGALLTLPIVAAGEIAGAVTLESPREAAFSEDEQQLLEQLIGLLGPLLTLKRQADASAWQRLRRQAGRQWARLRAPGVNRLKLLAGALAALALLAVVPLPYRVTAPARVEGEIQRVLAAPTDGFLQQVYARPGDSVKQGQVLVELAQQDLLLEQRRWQGEYAQHENAYGAAMARNDRGQLAISMARMQEAQAQLDLVQQQLLRARLVAPFDGIVAEGDLSQSLGAPVQKGNKLLTIAPRDRYRIIVEVDERDIARVAVGQEGALAPTARPGDPQEFIVTRITPVATVIGERNVFEVEAALTAHAGGTPPAPEGLRPGMKGAAKIAAGYRPLGWILFHGLANWLTLQLWRWGL